jgi:hypothetical protein
MTIRYCVHTDVVARPGNLQVAHSVATDSQHPGLGSEEEVLVLAGVLRGRKRLHVELIDGGRDRGGILGADDLLGTQHDQVCAVDLHHRRQQLRLAWS